MWLVFLSLPFNNNKWNTVCGGLATRNDTRTCVGGVVPCLERRTEAPNTSIEYRYCNHCNHTFQILTVVIKESWFFLHLRTSQTRMLQSSMEPPKKQFPFLVVASLLVLVLLVPVPLYGAVLLVVSLRPHWGSQHQQIFHNWQYV